MARTPFNSVGVRDDRRRVNFQSTSRRRGCDISISTLLIEVIIIFSFFLSLQMFLFTIL